ncbi:MAG: hypothetical protein ACTSRH_16460 [Promethearchaeota archaeon]
MNKYTVISNTTPLLAFLKKNELNLLKLLFNELLIPKAVFNEIVKHEGKYLNEIELLKYEIEQGWIKIKNVKLFKLSKLNLGRGEIEAINLCFEYESPLLLIDEKKARNIANFYNIKIIGTLGILLLANKKKLKNKQEIIQNLNMLVENNFYFSTDVILSFLERI